MKFGHILLIAAALVPVSARAEKNMSDQELNGVMATWVHRCQDYATGEGRPDLKKTCLKMVLSDLAEVDQLREDPQVSDVMWHMCRMESGFSRTGDFHEWAACMRVAKTRPWLRGQ